MRLIVTLLLMTLAVPAWAVTWERMFSMPSADFYIDFNSIRKHEHLHRVWILTDLKQPTPSGARSLVFLMELDCKEERHRNLELLSIEGQMGVGLALKNEPQSGRWKYIRPNSPPDLISKVVCPR